MGRIERGQMVPVNAVAVEDRCSSCGLPLPPEGIALDELVVEFETREGLEYIQRPFLHSKEYFDELLARLQSKSGSEQ